MSACVQEKTMPTALAPSLLALDDASSAHARANAHGDHAELALRALQLWQQRGDLPGAGATQRVAQGDRAALGVDLLHGDLEV
eukprot:CAMPEP_0175246494 /NCGR_PEP_ID=MMETSP0093-20121207/33132_1 /TAXON_ID=311494 /ORGANISM="Alexandrium monilatum, Strain CCMP3105" /LENGTH=82 /DNA_ID=CAMNT_0016540641 /DNA_START=8 /DNA_END=253 /DNA_ORIENTATION=+